MAAVETADVKDLTDWMSETIEDRVRALVGSVTCKRPQLKDVEGCKALFFSENNIYIYIQKRILGSTALLHSILLSLQTSLGSQLSWPFWDLGTGEDLFGDLPWDTIFQPKATVVHGCEPKH